MVPGHEVVGVVDAVGRDVRHHRLGDRVGIAWLRGTCGRCRFCDSGRENLCLHPRFTGWDDDGGYAELAVVDERFAYRLPDGYDALHAAPLLCAGIIGLRALRRTGLPTGGRLGLYGFGASAHLTAQIAMAEGATVYVMTRAPAARELALRLGAAWAGDTFDAPPALLDGAIVFAPAGEIVPAALAALRRPPVPGAAAVQRHGQHARRRRRAAPHRPPPCASRCTPGRTRSTRPTGRSPTWPPTG